MPKVVSASLIIGLEIHVELATRTKMFSRALSPAHASMMQAEPEPNTLLDPTVLALPGALPVINREAVELSIRVGLALNCTMAPLTVWDRKGYFYPDMPKAYQISQYDRPLCGEGHVDLPAVDSAGFIDFSRPTRRIRILRAHLEEDAGKLLHESPGGFPLDHSIVDYNRAGTPLLEIVTQPDFTHADEVVAFARILRSICRFLRATVGVMQKGHMRFEPNINCRLALDDGRTILTPIVEIKNLNSFKSLKSAIEYEHAQQPLRWMQDAREMGAGMKTTRGWDDVKEVSFIQREKEDAHDYRYFPDPDLLPLHVDADWVNRIRDASPELPLARLRRYHERFGLAIKEAAALAEEPDDCDFYESMIREMVTLGTEPDRAGKVSANFLLGPLMKIANQEGTTPSTLGLDSSWIAAVAVLRERGDLSNQAVEPMLLAGRGQGPSSLDNVRDLARANGFLVEKDEGALLGWIDQVMAANPKVVEDVRGGKVQAAGRLVGEVMKLAGGRADAKTVREALLTRIQA
jgi:aspartyl-tRNA(Asn)/glutamyl-tRNA(Gln) amidotransferase subunit B